MGAGYPFARIMLVNFEKATLEMNADESITIYAEDGKVEIPCPADNDMYTAEVVEFIDCIENNRDSKIISPESTMLSIKLANIEKESALKGETIYV